MLYLALHSPFEFLIFILAILMVLSIHEFSHAWMANYLGDPTAKFAGRITLNPRAHLELAGSIFFLLFGFGWGKPVPVNPANFKNPKRDGAWTALAGPLSNLFTAMLFAIPLRYFLATDPMVYVDGMEGQVVLEGLRILSGMVFRLSIILFIFNLLPIPPLDGSKILGFFVPDRWYRHYVYWMHDNMRYFMLFIFVDIFLFSRLFGFSFVRTVVGFLYDVIASLILLGT